MVLLRLAKLKKLRGLGLELGVFVHLALWSCCVKKRKKKELLDVFV